MQTSLISDQLAYSAKFSTQQTLSSCNRPGNILNYFFIKDQRQLQRTMDETLKVIHFLTQFSGFYNRSLRIMKLSSTTTFIQIKLLHVFSNIQIQKTHFPPLFVFPFPVYPFSTPLLFLLTVTQPLFPVPPAIDHLEEFPPSLIPLSNGLKVPYIAAPFNKYKPDMSAAQDKIDTPKAKKHLWKRIGYVKPNGNMSETERCMDLRDRSHMHSADKKHSSYNSMIQRGVDRPIMQPEPAHSNSNENERTDHMETIHNDPALKDMLEQFKAMEQQQQAEFYKQERNPLAQSMDQFKHQRIPSNFLSQSVHMPHRPTPFVQSPLPQSQFQRKRIYTVEQIANSANEAATPKNQNPEHDINRGKMREVRKLMEEVVRSMREQVKNIRGELEKGREEMEGWAQGVLGTELPEFVRGMGDWGRGRHLEEVRKMRREFQGEKEMWEEEVRQAKQETEQSRARTVSLSVELKQKKKEAVALATELDQMQKSHQDELSRLQAKNKAQIQQLTVTSKQTLQQLTITNKSKLDQLMNQHLTNTSALRQQTIKLQAQNHTLKSLTSSSFLPDPKLSALCEQQKQQLMLKQIQITELKKELTQQYDNIQRLLGTLKELERMDESQGEESEIERRRTEVEVLTRRVEEVERELEEVNGRLEQAKRGVLELEEENFCLQQKIEGFEAETEEKLRELRKTLTKQNIAKMCVLEQQNFRLTSQVNQLTLELKTATTATKSRLRKSQGIEPRTRQQLPLPQPDSRFLFPQSQNFSKTPSYYQDEPPQSVTSNEAHDVLNSFERRRYEAVEYRSPDRDRERIRYGETGQNILSPGTIRHSRNPSRHQRDKTNEEELFLPFYKELNSKKQPNYSSKPQIHPSELPTYDTNSSKYNSIPLKTTKSGYLYEDILPMTQPRPKNKYRSTYGYSSPQRNTHRQHYNSPILDQPSYIAKADLNLNRIQAQLESLTQELKSQLAYVTKRIGR